MSYQDLKRTFPHHMMVEIEDGQQMMAWLSTRMSMGVEHGSSFAWTVNADPGSGVLWLSDTSYERLIEHEWIEDKR